MTSAGPSTPSLHASLPGYTDQIQNPEGSINQQSLRRRSGHSSIPPRYSLVFGDPDEVVPTGSHPTQHDFPLSSGLFRNAAWATLRIITRPSRSAHQVPKIYGGDDVSGAVKLDLTRSQSISSISIILKGRIVTSFSDQGIYTFLEEFHNVWQRSFGDPRSPESGQRFDGKLSGSYEFPFAFRFPTEVDISSGAVGKGKRAEREEIICITPQTFLEKHLGANIEYELVLQICHGVLRSDTKLKVPIFYIPEIRPDPPSLLRQASYAENGLLVGPDDDPEGWLVLPTIHVQGTFAGERSVLLDYTASLFLANPLSYTRGTVIPCYLYISCSEPKCLDVVADPKLQNVRLGRRVTFYKDPSRGISHHIQNKEPAISVEFDEAEVAQWWIPSKDIVQEPRLRKLQGEIHLAVNLPPSSSFLPFTVEYAVEVMTWNTRLFRYSSRTAYSPHSLQPNSKVLLTYPVTIATFHSRGPRARPYTEREKPSMANRGLPDDDQVMEQLGMYGELKFLG